MRYLTLFPEAANTHLVKDVGMIPYFLHRRFGHEATLACYDNGPYSYLDTEVNGLKLLRIKKVFHNPFADSLFMLLLKRRQYDVLQTFHFRFRSLVWLYLFKLLKPSGKTYLKLDANEYILNYLSGGLKRKIKEFLLRKIDLVSVESSHLQEVLGAEWQREIVYLPNGSSFTEKPIIPFSSKEKIILTVGRIGAPEKNHETLLEAFAHFSETHPGWKLEMAGPVAPEFQAYVHTYFERYPQLEQAVHFTGLIEDREALYQRYAQASIFCLTSLREGFPIVMAEAAAAGCFLVTSDILNAADITAKEQTGAIFPAGDTTALSRILTDVAGNEVLLRNVCSRVQEQARALYSWEAIAGKINILLCRG